MNNKLNRIKPEELASNLRQFTGTSGYFRYSLLFPYFLLTDGTKYLAESAECYWLMDFIASHQVNPLIRENENLKRIQFWQIRVDNNRAKIWVEEDKDEPVFSELIDYTDFPLERLTLYVQPVYLPSEQDRENWLCFLPSEY